MATTKTAEKIAELIKVLDKAEKKEFFFNKFTRGDTLRDIRIISQEKENAPLLSESFPTLLPLLVAVVKDSKSDSREHALSIIVNVSASIHYDVTSPLLFPLLTDIIEKKDKKDSAARDVVFAAIVNLGSGFKNVSQMTTMSLGLVPLLLRLARDDPKDRPVAVRALRNMSLVSHCGPFYLAPYLLDLVPLLISLARGDDDEVKHQARGVLFNIACFIFGIFVVYSIITFFLKFPWIPISIVTVGLLVKYYREHIREYNDV